MLRLTLTAAACAMNAALAAAAELPYRVTLVGDGYDGTGWHTGVRIELDPGWKTYWRMPGDAGIAPEFSWSARPEAALHVDYPVPQRFSGAGGETVGYENEVVFPVGVLTVKDTEVKLHLDLFFAVCKDICIPAKAEASIRLGPMVRDPQGTALVERWEKAVPVEGTPVRSARVTDEAGKPVLELTLAEAVDDIFVEAPGGAYVGAPQFSADGLTARLPVANVKDAAALKGAALAVTLRKGEAGLEQSLTLP